MARRSILEPLSRICEARYLAGGSCSRAPLAIGVSCRPLRPCSSEFLRPCSSELQRRSHFTVSVYFYTGPSFDADVVKRQRALQAGAFACTHRPEDLLPLILAAAGRSALPSATAAREVRVLEVLRSIGIERAWRARVPLG